MADLSLHPETAPEAATREAVPPSHSPIRGTAGQAPFGPDADGTSTGTAAGTMDLKSLARLVLMRDNRRDKGRDAGFEACPKAGQPEGTADGTGSGTRRGRAGPGWGGGRDAEPAAAIGIPETLLLRDGRQMHRFIASAIPADVPDGITEAMDRARNLGAVLVADGHELIVVEPAGELPLPILTALCLEAGAAIAALRSEHWPHMGEKAELSMAERAL